VVRSGLIQGLEVADRVVFGVSALMESPTRLEGSKRSFGISALLWVAGHVPSGAVARVRVLAAWAGLRLRGVVGEDSRGEETQESNGHWREATRVSSERIREGRNASKQVKLAESGGFIA
jgi:hypothetical protein